MMTILITGVAGFIGAALAQRLLEAGHTVVGLDNLNEYYSVALKQARLAHLQDKNAFHFAQTDLADQNALEQLFKTYPIRHVVNLAAQAGVRYSLQNPQAYVQSNLVGFLNILENCRHHSIEHLVYASSSSVYGLNSKMPFAVTDNVDHPVSLYAASKKANELMAHSYSHLYALPCTGLRFFTVYGPWGRPDMAYFKFTKAILAGQAIDVYNHGKMQRDFTYIDDIIEGIVRVLDCIPQANSTWNGAQPDPGSSTAPYRLYNIGNHQPVELMRFIEVLEESLGQKAIKNMLPMQSGDVTATYADISDLEQAVGFTPKTSIESGLEQFVAWYRTFYATGCHPT